MTYTEMLDNLQNALIAKVMEVEKGTGISYSEPDLSIASLVDYIEAVTGEDLQSKLPFPTH